MVYNIITPKLKAKLPKGESPLPEHYYSSAWQKTYEVKLWFLIYRIFMAVTTFTITILSIIVHKDEDPDGSQWKWLIYMTHWSYIMIVLQFFMAAFIASDRYITIKLKDSSAEPQITVVHTIYGALHTTASVMALGVTALYWSLIYNPALHSLDFMNYAMHAMNSVIMVVDLMLISQPIHFAHILYPFLFSVTYVLFSLIYKLFGGTGKLNKPTIYPILDWDTPVRTLTIAIFALFFIMMMHVIVYCLVLLRRRLVQIRRPMVPEVNSGFQDKYTIDSTTKTGHKPHVTLPESIVDII